VGGSATVVSRGTPRLHHRGDSARSEDLRKATGDCGTAACRTRRLCRCQMPSSGDGYAGLRLAGRAPYCRRQAAWVVGNWCDEGSVPVTDGQLIASLVATAGTTSMIFLGAASLMRNPLAPARVHSSTGYPAAPDATPSAAQTDISLATTGRGHRGGDCGPPSNPATLSTIGRASSTAGPLSEGTSPRGPTAGCPFGCSSTR
jgi:hypothetical protein